MNHITTHLLQTIALLENHDLAIDVSVLWRLEAAAENRRRFEADRFVYRAEKTE